MTAPTPNVELLDRVLAVIEADPDRWDQITWRQSAIDGCGTTFCFAGWACQLDGGTWADGPDELYSDYLVARDGETFGPTSRGVKMTFARDRALAALGLTGDEADALFHAINDLTDLRRQVQRIKARAADLLRAASADERQPRERTHAGSSKARQEVGDPGHCETCVSVGHEQAHPALGCSDVGCYDDHTENRQPREHPVPCQVCHRPTWEVSADCGQHTTAGAP